MKPIQIFGHQLARVSAPEGELKGSLDMECSVPRFRVDHIRSEQARAYEAALRDVATSLVKEAMRNV